jgi:hypothetical protein
LGQQTVERIREVLCNTGRIHGSQIVDLLITEAAGRWNCDSHDAERLIETLGLVPENAAKPDPTFSQRAFLGLQFKKHPGFVPGCKVHYWFRQPSS